MRCTELVAVQVQIGTADADGVDAHDGLSRFRRRGSGRSSSSTVPRAAVTATLMTRCRHVGQEGDHLVGDEIGQLEVQRMSALGDQRSTAPSIAAA